MRLVTSTILAAALALALGCGDDSTSNSGQVCTPGGTQVCACPGGGQGAQTCNLDGKSWGLCNCGSKPDAGGVGPTCIPGTTQTCVCGGGGSGAQSCNTDGKSWSTCDCTTKLDKGTVKLDSGGQPPTPAVGKFCNEIKVNDKPVTLSLRLGTGSNQVTLTAVTGSCSVLLNSLCDQIPTGVQLSFDLVYQGQVWVKGNATISAGEDWIFLATVNSSNVPDVIGGALKVGYHCSSYKPW